MNLKQQLLTNNDCYKAGKKITVKGLMIHSTGANNPNLSRYVGPDDGLLGKNPAGTDWNHSGIDKCVHGFIGKLKDGNIATYQTLPWDHRGWHAGGSANDTYIGVEICEDDLKDPKYFAAVYKEAVEFFTYLCKKFKLTEKNVITHCEGHDKGIASNHGDVMHWFPKHGKSMDTFRSDIKKGLSVKPADPKPVDKPTPVVPKPAEKTIDQLAQEVIKGLHGSGDARKKALGSKYDAVQKRVGEILASKKAPVKTISQLADEVIKGVHGSGRERMLSLGKNYAAVQSEVTRRLRNK